MIIVYVLNINLDSKIASANLNSEDSEAAANKKLLRDSSDEEDTKDKEEKKEADTKKAKNS